MQSACIKKTIIRDRMLPAICASSRRLQDIGSLHLHGERDTWQEDMRIKTSGNSLIDRCSSHKSEWHHTVRYRLMGELKASEAATTCI
eukprot:gene15162-21233_t